MEVPVNDENQEELLDKEGNNWACSTAALVHIPMLYGARVHQQECGSFPGGCEHMSAVSDNMQELKLLYDLAVGGPEGPIQSGVGTRELQRIISWGSFMAEKEALASAEAEAVKDSIIAGTLSQITALMKVRF